MVLYHGSYKNIPNPQILDYGHTRSFGIGFYTTTNKEQAISFSLKVVKRITEGIPTVNIYDFNMDEAKKECSILSFDGPTEEWLDFVVKNREGQKLNSYDIVFGPVADDNVYRTLALYIAGDFTKEETLEKLKIRKLYNQLVLSSDKALKYLVFKGVLPKEEIHE